MPHQRLAVGWRQDSYSTVPAVVGVFHEFLNTFHRGRDDGHAVAPLHVVEELVDLVNGAAENDVLGISVTQLVALIDFFLGDGCGEGFEDLWPQHGTGIELELFLGVGGKSAGIDRHTQDRDAVVVGCCLGLCVKTRCGNHD